MKREALQTLLLNTFGHLDDVELLALTIFGEARGERDQGKIAVASVILERVEHRDWDGTTIKGVCLCPEQFSCYLPKDKNFRLLEQIAGDWQAALARSSSLRTCYGIAAGLLSGAIARDPIVAANHATQYLTVDCTAAWEAKMRKVATIGAHEFYA
jgi:hypothetical protein